MRIRNNEDDYILYECYQCDNESDDIDEIAEWIEDKLRDKKTEKKVDNV